MGLVYRPSPGVNLKVFNGRPVFSTEQGGLIYTDRAVTRIWNTVAESDFPIDLDQISADTGQDRFTRAALACLAEAGCLERIDGEVSGQIQSQHQDGEMVSVILICHESLEWLKICLPSIAAQYYSPLETILVDNGSNDNTYAWIKNNYPSVYYYRLENPGSLANAINFGISMASGSYFLLLNPDTRITHDAISNLVKTAQTDPLCAAVAAKLRLLRVPAFLNGLGNYVGGISWGTDAGLGHLDLGQFDGWKFVPSACFAAALIPATAWNAVGQLDAGFPMYYEDSEWCYRARKFGYRILAAPQAVVFHAFSGQNSPAPAGAMDHQKLRRVAYGRLRFACLIFSFPVLLRYLAVYIIEDIFRIAWSLLSGQFEKVSAHLNAWKDFNQSLPEIKASRNAIRSKMVVNDRELISLHQQVPVPLVRHGIPLLTREVIENEYLPLILAGKTKKLPEISPEEMDNVQGQDWISRLVRTWQVEGFSAMLHRIGRLVEWWLL